MNKLLMTILVLLMPLSAAAGDSACTISADMVKQISPQNAAAVATHYWESGRDKRSDEHLKTLHIIYKNGDHAVIQHKYCSMYNFEVVYLRNSQRDYPDAGVIAKIVAGLYMQYSAKQAKFSRPLEDIISASLKKGGFDIDKDFGIGLPGSDVSYPNESISYSFDYKTLDEFSSIYSSVSRFYMGIGGEH